jgi:hypothetical protein
MKIYLLIIAACLVCACSHSEEPQLIHLLVSNSGSNDFKSVRVQMNSKTQDFGLLRKGAEKSHMFFKLPIGTTNIITSWLEQGILNERSATIKTPQTNTIASQIMLWEINISNGVVRTSSRTTLAPNSNEELKR